MNISLKGIRNKRLQDAEQQLGEQSSESNFSVSKARRAERKIRKKKLTKIVHTCCFFYFDLKGHRHTYFYQRTTQTNLKDPSVAKNFAISTSLDHNNKLLEEWKSQVFLSDKHQLNYGDNSIGLKLVSQPLQPGLSPYSIVQ